MAQLGNENTNTGLATFMAHSNIENVFRIAGITSAQARQATLTRDINLVNLSVYINTISCSRGWDTLELDSKRMILAEFGKFNKLETILISKETIADTIASNIAQSLRQKHAHENGFMRTFTNAHENVHYTQTWKSKRDTSHHQMAEYLVVAATGAVERTRNWVRTDQLVLNITVEIKSVTIDFKALKWVLELEANPTEMLRSLQWTN